MCSPERIGITMSDHIVVGEVDWMRNDYPCDITVGKYTYPTVEHAYQAAKFKDDGTKQAIADAGSIREARDIGRNNPMRDDWDDVRASVMESLVRQKFTNRPALGDRLAKTGNADIVMEGYDEFWGTGRSGHGENTLGDILETVRSELQFLHGIDPDEYDAADDQSEGSSLKISLINNPSAHLADACQKLYVGAQKLMELVDPNDFDVSFISRRTGVGDAAAKDAIEKLQSMMSALNSITDILAGDEEVVGVLSTLEDDDDDQDGQDIGDHPDPWLSPMD